MLIKDKQSIQKALDEIFAHENMLLLDKGDFEKLSPSLDGVQGVRVAGISRCPNSSYLMKLFPTLTDGNGEWFWTICHMAPSLSLPFGKPNDFPSSLSYLL